MLKKLITFEEFNDNHLIQLHQWLQLSHVREFWDDGDRTLEQVKSHYSAEKGVKRYLFFINNHPAGYIQSYVIDRENEYYHFSLADKQNLGIDFFIGNESLLEKGFAIQVLAEFVLSHCQDIERLIVDPKPSNHKAIHIYEKYGFTKVGEVMVEGNNHFIMAMNLPSTIRKFLSDQQISDSLKIHYDIDIIKLFVLPKGADINACVFKADAKDQSSYFVKQRLGYHDEINLTIVELLVQAGIQPIIPPIKTKQQQSMVSIKGSHLIVYPFIEGQDGFSHPLSDKQWIKLGKALRQIHDLKVPMAVRKKLRKENYTSKFRQSVRSLYNQFNTLLVKDEIAEKLFIYLKQEQKAILHLVDSAENLAKKIISSLNPKYNLCHSDIHAGNVLINGEDTLYIVDWDEPMMAPRERDLMFIGGGVGNVWNQPHEEILFYQGYGEVTIDKNILAYYRHERIVQDIAEYAAQLLLSTAGGESRKIMFQHFMGMFASRGVVEIALRQ
ncbi:MAG: GNAT family N-acetyltransferase [Proteobacteria bacterium]|nr:GNAT family N-acetyltransferase [Pseudomonadota bacterium]